jgi:pyrimidine-nucleoside phosphorylase
MIVPRLIERKRDGGNLSAEEWTELVSSYAQNKVPDYQMSALLMACYFSGLNTSEMTALTEAMLMSGSRFDLSHLAQPRIDKHSMGGVGDKTSLILAPLISCLDIAVPMISGRGLGHTGGTLDKLESIPGFRTGLSMRESKAQIERLGCAMVGQTAEIAPADKKIYALRDATATVEVVQLIASSIMSKKLAESLTGLVLDIKGGSGSFLPDLEKELELAQAMIALGIAHDCPVVALITAMDRPLGYACGNAIEVVECINALHGNGPEDLMTVTFALGAEMILLGGRAKSHAEAHEMMRNAISSGKAAEKLEEIVVAQHGDARVVSDVDRLPQAKLRASYNAPRSGFINGVEPRTIGHGIIALGGGRTTMEDTIDPSVGFVITAKPGREVKAGDELAVVHAWDQDGADIGAEVLAKAISIGDEPEPFLPLISHRITAAGVEKWSG